MNNCITDKDVLNLKTYFKYVYINRTPTLITVSSTRRNLESCETENEKFLLSMCFRASCSPALNWKFSKKFPEARFRSGLWEACPWWWPCIDRFTWLELVGWKPDCCGLTCWRTWELTGCPTNFTKFSKCLLRIS